MKQNIKNLGLEILRAILCFWVVYDHCSKSSHNFLLKILFKKRFHVPSFMIMSFYFMQKTLILLNFKLLCHRIIRLMIPYLGWPIIIFALNNLILAKILKLNKTYSFQDLKIYH